MKTYWTCYVVVERDLSKKTLDKNDVGFMITKSDVSDRKALELALVSLGKSKVESRKLVSSINDSPLRQGVIAGISYSIRRKEM